MSYYAVCSGDIFVDGVKDQSELEKVIKRWCDEFEFDGSEISIYGCNIYYKEEYMTEFFEELGKLAEVESGILDFNGEDSSFWRFEYKVATKEWEEIQGDIYYTKPGEPSYEALKVMFIDYVTNDAEGSGDPGYILQALETVGCNAECRKALGLDFEEEGVVNG